jgi:hypothetical protein
MGAPDAAEHILIAAHIQMFLFYEAKQPLSEIKSKLHNSEIKRRGTSL